MHVPISKPWIEPRDFEAVAKVLKGLNLTSSAYEGGELVKELEGKVAKLFGYRNVVAVNSGTSALLASLMCIGVGPGDEVILPSFTFVATANAVAALGAKPVFCDIKLEDYGADAADVERKVTERTKAIIAVHLYGYPCGLDELSEVAEKHGLVLIEDAAQALGSRYRGRYVGGFGGLGCFSLYPSKMITAGEGGFVVTGDDELADKLRMVRNHGISKEGAVEVVGLNLRMTEISAAIALAQLSRFSEIVARRKRVAEFYSSALAETELVLPKFDGEREPNWNYYTVRVRGGRRDALLERLRSAGVGAAVYYRTPVHMQPLYARMCGALKLPNTELASREVLSLPIYPTMTEEEMLFVANAVVEGLAALR